jgi:hypothetical protein
LFAPRISFPALPSSSSLSLLTPKSFIIRVLTRVFRFSPYSASSRDALLSFSFVFFRPVDLSPSVAVAHSTPFHDQHCRLNSLQYEIHLRIRFALRRRRRGCPA